MCSFIPSLSRSLNLHLILVLLCSLGPAFIKWGQWASTRPDIFPADICDELSRLHMQVCKFFLWKIFSRFWSNIFVVTRFGWIWQAPRHSYAETRKIMQKAFRVPIEVLFDEFEKDPVASGSIAQVCNGCYRTLIYICTQWVWFVRYDALGCKMFQLNVSIIT